MEFQWKIENLQSRVDDGFVVLVFCNVTATDGDIRANSPLSIKFEQNQEIFIPFNELTEAIVIDWVQTASGKEKVERMLIEQIDQFKNPPFKDGLPWTTAEEV
jgi:hypothetical protein